MLTNTDICSSGKFCITSEICGHYGNLSKLYFNVYLYSNRGEKVLNSITIWCTQDLRVQQICLMATCIFKIYILVASRANGSFSKTYWIPKVANFAIFTSCSRACPLLASTVFATVWPARSLPFLQLQTYVSLLPPCSALVRVKSTVVQCVLYNVKGAVCFVQCEY